MANIKIVYNLNHIHVFWNEWSVATAHNVFTVQMNENREKAAAAAAN